ncbi:MAG: hypothetical protein EPN94_03915 [Nitrospirae bacterium]|nr:MAG: hypothetical protein EPN94_03915 [Nitrospirota bacterium]
MMYSRLKPALLIIGIFLFLGCSREPVVARVNGEAITQKDIKVLLKHAGIKEDSKMLQSGGIHNTMQQELLDQLINEKLMLQAAKKEKIRVDKKEVMNAYNNMVKAFLKEADYLQRLKQKGLSKDIVLKSIEKDLIVGKFKDSLSRSVSVSEEELKGYYDNNLRTFAVAEQMRLSIIKATNIEEAKRIKKEIDKGASFEEMADKYPAGHTGPGERETGWITLDTFPADMAKAITKIKTGTAGGPIKGREGYYIIKVMDKKEKKIRSFDEVKENIEHQLTQQKARDAFQSWLQDARKNAKIELPKKG